MPPAGSVLRPTLLPAVLTLLCALVACGTLPRTPAASASVAGAVYFEANRGQTDPRVRFLAHGPGYCLFLTPGETVLTLARPAPVRTRGDRGPARTRGNRGCALAMRLTGADLRAPMEGLAELPGRVNYLTGRDPSRWHTRIPTFARVRQPNVYPGIDLVYYGTGAGIEHDFVVRPGASPGEIRLAFSGAQSARLDAHGDLLLGTSAGTVRQRRPVIYQEVDGRRMPVRGGYVLLAHERREPGQADRDGEMGVRFVVGRYDRTRPLVVDPVLEPPTLQYSTFLGGSGVPLNVSSVNTVGTAVAADAAGSAYVAGLTISTDFPTTPGSFRPTKPIGIDGFVTKFSPDASTLIYSTFLGGVFGAASVAVDAVGSAYVTGYVVGPSRGFPTTPGAFQPSAPHGGSVVMKLAPDGASLIYSTFLTGSAGTSAASALAVDPSGAAYLVGTTRDADFPTTPGSFRPVNPTPNSVPSFVTKLAPDGGSLVYSTYLTIGTVYTFPYAIAVDSTGAAYVTGSTTDSSFPVTPSAFQSTGGNPKGTAFVTKLAPDGASLVYSTFLGGTGGDLAGGIAVPPSGESAFVVGKTASLDFPTTRGAFWSRIRAPQQFQYTAFVTRLAPDGRSLIYSTYVGDGPEIPTLAALDRSGNAVSFAAGTPPFTRWIHYPLTENPSRSIFPNTGMNGAASEVLLTQVAPAGDRLLYCAFLGPSSRIFWQSALPAVGTDTAGGVYVTGQALSGFPTTPGAFQPHNNGGRLGNAFVTKLILQPTFSLSGQVTSMGVGLRGIAVRAGNAQTITDANGNYRFDGLDSGTQHVVRPASSGFRFEPPSYQVRAHQDVANADFRAVKRAAQ